MQGQLKTFGKFLQKRLYSYLNTWIGFSTTIFLALVVIAFTVYSPAEVNAPAARLCNDCNVFYDNIGNVDVKNYISHGPIDAVYTWVNGSDPIWMKKKDKWTKYTATIDGTETFESNSTLQGDNASVNNSTESHEDDTMSQNRYRDSEELRYSLRSLVKNAPWIRKIYIVTDNQIPYWLNLEHGDRLTVVSHQDIFANKSNLPVFSSPAIESQLHHIPGLSQKFIYFNDDVFLGAPVYPDDFLSLSGAQKFYMSWDVPKCAPGCSDNWIGDGVCDKACNVSTCNFDYPDCVNASSPAISTGTSNSGSNPTYFCTRGCPDSWLADKVCDVRCKVEECGWDLGDCGLDLVTNNFHEIMLSAQNTEITRYNKADVIDTVEDANKTEEVKDHVLAATVPFGTKAMYFNVSQLACESTNDPVFCNITEKAEFTFDLSEFEDNTTTVHTAVMLLRHQLMVALFHHGEEEGPPIPSTLPLTVRFRVGGTNKATNQSLLVDFYVKFTPSETQVDMSAGIPSEMSAVKGHTSACPTTTLWQGQHVTLISNPYRLHGGLASAVEEGVMVSSLFHGLPELLRETSEELSVYTAITEPNGKISVTERSLCSSMGKLTHGDYKVVPLFSEGSECPANLVELISADRSQQLVEQDLYPLKLLLPMRKQWHETPLHWLHVKTVIANKSHGDVADRRGEWIDMECPSSSQGSNDTTKAACDLQALVAQRMGLSTANNGTMWCALTSFPWGGYVPKTINDTTENNSTSLNHTSESLDTVTESSHHRRLNAMIAEDIRDASTRLIAKRVHQQMTAALPPTPVSNKYRYDLHWQHLQQLQQQHHQQYQQQHHSRSIHRRLDSQKHEKEEEEVVVPDNGRRNLAAGMWTWITNMLGFKSNVNTEIRRRKLVDTYAQSLIHVNRLYNKEFGFEARKVPAHMPHMIDKEVMSELQGKWPQQWKDTASHRFRSTEDMQYSFAYYYFAMNRNKASPPEIAMFLRDRVDTNEDGFIDDNELRSLASMVFKRSPRDMDYESIRNCTRNSSISSISSGSIHGSVDYEETTSQRTAFGHLRKSFSLQLYPTVAELANCSTVQEGLKKNVDWSKYRPTHSMGVETEIAFEMIGDNYTESTAQLDSVRQRQCKFVCINDNMKNPSKELVAALHDFYLSFFPEPCIFELPTGTRNPTLYWDEYKDMHKSSGAKPSWKKAQAAAKESSSWLAEYKEYLVSKTVKILLDSISDQYDEETTDSVISGLRQDLVMRQMQIKSKQTQRRTYFGAFSVLLSILGLAGLIFLRWLRRQRSIATIPKLHRHAWGEVRVDESHYSTTEDDDDDEDDSDNDGDFGGPPHATSPSSSSTVEDSSASEEEYVAMEVKPLPPREPIGKGGLKKDYSQSKRKDLHVKWEDQKKTPYYPGKYAMMAGRAFFGNKNAKDQTPSK